MVGLATVAVIFCGWAVVAISCCRAIARRRPLCACGQAGLLSPPSQPYVRVVAPLCPRDEVGPPPLPPHARARLGEAGAAITPCAHAASMPSLPPPMRMSTSGCHHRIAHCVRSCEIRSVPVAPYAAPPRARGQARGRGRRRLLRALLDLAAAHNLSTTPLCHS